MDLFKFIGTIIMIFFGIIGIVIVSGWFLSCQEAKVVRRLTEVKYTCGDIFWARDTVNQQIQRELQVIIK